MPDDNRLEYQTPVRPPTLDRTKDHLLLGTIGLMFGIAMLAVLFWWIVLR